MNDKPDGGLAFPALDASGTGGLCLRESGMSLRDYFAAKAMPEIYQRVESGGFERVAILSYELADAMLKARSA